MEATKCGAEMVEKARRMQSQHRIVGLPHLKITAPIRRNLFFNASARLQGSFVAAAFILSKYPSADIEQGWNVIFITLCLEDYDRGPGCNAYSPNLAAIAL